MAHDLGSNSGQLASKSLSPIYSALWPELIKLWAYKMVPKEGKYWKLFKTIIFLISLKHTHTDKSSHSHTHIHIGNLHIYIYIYTHTHTHTHTHIYI